MPEPEIRHELDAADVAVIHRLLGRAAEVDGRFPLSDHLRLELDQGGRPGFAVVTVGPPERPVGYAQLANGNDAWTTELVVDPDRRAQQDELSRALLRAVVGIVAHAGGGVLNWWVVAPTATHGDVAASVGLSPGRQLFQMRRTLPTGETVEVPTRAFMPGADEEAWLRVNNRAFATHPEQGGWTIDTLRQREGEPWFDPQGFLLHERNGHLAAFCWTKLHIDADPVMGEIYVIAVDPDFQGLGLGPQLTLAGLESISARHVDVGMLYVDGDNTGAVAMYEQLGFTVHRCDRAYTGRIGLSAEEPG